MRQKSGIEPLDRRLGGLAVGSLHLLAGVPGSGRLIALLHFLAEGLADGGRVALVGALPPERVLEQGRHWGVDLEAPWREGRLRLLTFNAEFERRLLSAAEPGEVFSELETLLGAEELERLAIHPGSPLWETRSGTNLASQFVRWTGSLNVTTWATLSTDLDGTLTPATEWVLQAASGLFHLKRLPGGLHELSIRRLSPPAAIGEAITLEADPGQGLVAPTGRLDRRRTDPEPGSEGRLAILRLASVLPAELQAWARDAHQDGVVEAGDPLQLMERLQEGEAFGMILVYLERSSIDEAVQACRILRRLTTAPILVATEHRLRSGDRVQILEAGGSDVLSAPLNLAELSFRSKRVRERRVAEPPARRSSPPVPDRPGILDEEDFAEAVRERLAHPEWKIFTLVRVERPAGVAERLRRALLSEIREEAGDLVGALGGAFGVLLQGAEVQHVEGFLQRLRQALGNDDLPLVVRSWSGLTDGPAITGVLAVGEADSSSVAS